MVQIIPVASDPDLRGNEGPMIAISLAKFILPGIMALEGHPQPALIMLSATYAIEIGTLISFRFWK